MSEIKDQIIAHLKQPNISAHELARLYLLEIEQASESRRATLIAQRRDIQGLLRYLDTQEVGFDDILLDLSKVQ
jgi:hypothetical protein